MVTTALLTLQYGYPDNKRLSQVVYYGALPLAMIVMNIGLAGFKANIIPFGIDQHFHQMVCVDHLPQCRIGYLPDHIRSPDLQKVDPHSVSLSDY